MRHGVVKFFNVDQGFGFISPIDGGMDILVQRPEVERAGLGSLLVGQRIGFQLAENDNGPGKIATQLSLLAANEDDGGVKRFG